MDEHELPISRERLEELYAAHGLSEEARNLVERLGANQELDPELRLPAEAFIESLEALSDADRPGVETIFEEIAQAYKKRMDEARVGMEWAERAEEAYDRAAELDASISRHSTLGEIRAVFEAHGEPFPLTEEDMNRQIEVEPPISAEDLIAVPEGEVPCDENGIPTPSASRNGVGFPDPDDEDSTIFLSSLELEAVRWMAQEFTFQGFVEEHLHAAAEMKEEFLAELGDALGGSAESYAKQMVSQVLRTSYVQALAKTVQDYPHSPHDIIHYFKGKKSKGADRYKEYVVSATMKSMVEEQSQRLIDEGVFEQVFAPDGKEYLKKGPNYEEFASRMKESAEED